MATNRRAAARVLPMAAISLLALVACAQAAPRGSPAAANKTAAAPAPETLKIRGVDYVDSRIFFARRGLKGAWTKPNQAIRYQGPATKIEIEAESREVSFDGMRVFLGEPVAAAEGSLYIAKTDAEKLFAAILRPTARAAAPKVIVIDPGHGGDDPGKENARLKLNEKTQTLDVALRLARRLQADGYQVVLTRKDDRHLSSNKIIDLQARADIANNAKADLFISIHFNSVPDKDAARVTGSETYSFTPQYQRSTASSERDPTDAVAEPGNANDVHNVLLAYCVQREVLSRLGTSDRGLKRARFAVLRRVNCPAVLIEAGFLSNDTEAKRIATPAYRQLLAESIADAVKTYVVATTPAVPSKPAAAAAGTATK